MSPARPAAAGGPGGRAAAARALRLALAAEQAAVYGYAVLGAHLPAAERAVATTDWIAHQRARDMLETLLSARGAAAPSGPVAYRLPALASAAQARSLAVFIENRVTAAYLSLVAVPEAALRELGARAVRDGALRAVSWGGPATAFPGLG